MKKLFHASFAYALAGVLSGLYYREFTKANGFTGESQLGLVHTHWLVLGFIVLLLVLMLERSFGMSAAAPRLSAWFFWIWNAGVVVTGGMMLVKGTLVVAGAGSGAGFKALAGIAGTGHMLLTAGLVLLFLALRKALAAAPQAAASLPAAPGPLPAGTNA
ncbi:DUF2871 domain-containing protein [Arthrobacter sp. B10-11]|uniref:DUF2871 domain-containing protein n=1 Tax=Arthrobacter sp. B10-11 TaxID=3081160 RepID=UPI0029543E0E|nr:DUF2871 domain-containing protein [Arthrobacter sp. B10-11]MDV8147576.1 DUF2871 domain-containing protein [Arthrobacter sp. B10-11]